MQCDQRLQSYCMIIILASCGHVVQSWYLECVSSIGLHMSQAWCIHCRHCPSEKIKNLTVCTSSMQDLPANMSSPVLSAPAVKAIPNANWSGLEGSCNSPCLCSKNLFWWGGLCSWGSSACDWGADWRMGPASQLLQYLKSAASGFHFFHWHGFHSPFPWHFLQRGQIMARRIKTYLCRNGSVILASQFELLKYTHESDQREMMSFVIPSKGQWNWKHQSGPVQLCWH